MPRSPEAVAAVLIFLAQAAPPAGDPGDYLRTFLTAGVAGAALLAAIFGFIFFKPERTQLIGTIEELRAANDRYVEMHQNTTIPTLTKALSLLETTERTLQALTKAWEEQNRTNTEVQRRLELLERQIDTLDRRLT